MVIAIGATTAKTLDDCVSEIQSIADAAHQVREEIIILLHGGPIAEPEDAEYVLSRTKGTSGFYGASSMERLPVEIALRDVTRKFKSVSLIRANVS